MFSQLLTRESKESNRNFTTVEFANTEIRNMPHPLDWNQTKSEGQETLWADSHECGRKWLSQSHWTVSLNRGQSRFYETWSFYIFSGRGRYSLEKGILNEYVCRMKKSQHTIIFCGKYQEVTKCVKILAFGTIWRTSMVFSLRFLSASLTISSHNDNLGRHFQRQIYHEAPQSQGPSVSWILCKALYQCFYLS